VRSMGGTAPTIKNTFLPAPKNLFRSTDFKYIKRNRMYRVKENK
jgi:hypothetical protein